MNPVAGSPTAAMSGTRRRVLAAKGAVVTSDCHDGLVKYAEAPPPVPPVAPLLLPAHVVELVQVQADSVQLVPVLGARTAALRRVPPTPTTTGEDAGKSTRAPLEAPQS